MTDKVRITVLVENTAQGEGLLAEHGLSFWIEIGSHSILFDTGQGGVIVNNAYKLKAPLGQVDAIVLSHGHYDHTGGLADALRGSQATAIYLHPDALKPKFACNKDGSSREIGISYASEQPLLHRKEQMVFTEKPTPIGNRLTVTGPIPRLTDYEDTGGPFFLDAQCQKPDPLFDDQAVFFESDHGMVVLLGCAHSGVINTLHHVRKLTGDRHIHAVLGGMHLVGASPQRVKRTIDQLREFKIDRLGPAHCTGRAATAALWDALPDRCVPCHVGSQFEFNLSTLSPIGA